MKIEIPKCQAELLRALRFVIAARSKEQTRYGISHIKVEKNKFIATDGKRLHIAEVEHNYEVGMYEVMKCTQSTVVMLKNEDAGNFPNYQDVVPKHEKFFSITGSYEKSTFLTSILVGLGKVDVFVNSNFLQPLLEIDTWQVFYGEPDRPVLFKANKLSAILIPFHSEPVIYETI